MSLLSSIILPLIFGILLARYEWLSSEQKMLWKNYPDQYKCLPSKKKMLMMVWVWDIKKFVGE